MDVLRILKLFIYVMVYLFFKRNSIKILQMNMESLSVSCLTVQAGKKPDFG